MPGTSIGKFQVIGPLGTGAHSTILHVRREEDSRHYALKVVPIAGPQDAKFLEQARHEFQIAQMLDHPSLIKIYTLESQRDWLFRIRKVQLLIEYVNGQTLDTFKVIPIPQLVQIFEQIAAGLAHMHQRGVFHADLKPNNILLSRKGEVKIIDFGLAWIKGQAKERVQGTPEYMAPETGREKVVNERTDIYNLGATMYRLVTWRLPPSTIPIDGGLPVSSRNFAQMLRPVTECNALAPPELGKLIHRCLAFDPLKRPATVAEIKDLLTNLVGQLVLTSEDRLEAYEW